MEVYATFFEHLGTHFFIKDNNSINRVSSKLPPTFPSTLIGVNLLQIFILCLKKFLILK